MAAQSIKKHFGSTSGLDILDLGAADGRALVEMQGLLKPRSLTGVELSDDIPSCIPPHLTNTRLVRGDIARLPSEVASKKYHAVTALAVLEHLNDPLEAMKQARNVLHPSGILVATCPVPFWDKISTTLGLLEDSQHEIHPDRKQLQNLAFRAGFIQVSCNLFMFAPLAALTYARIPVPVKPSLLLDAFLEKLPPCRPFFVNQCLTAVKK